MSDAAVRRLVEQVTLAGQHYREQHGQKTLGWLLDVLKAVPDHTMLVRWDTGEEFGRAPIRWRQEEPFVYDKRPEWSQPGYDSADSETAHPSCYRGYYNEGCFNCSMDHEPATVGIVLAMVEDTIGKSFSGYKGGVYPFDRGTLVWGSAASWSSTVGGRMLTGFKVAKRGGNRPMMILETAEEPAIDWSPQR